MKIRVTLKSMVEAGKNNIAGTILTAAAKVALIPFILLKIWVYLSYFSVV